MTSWDLPAFEGLYEHQHPLHTLNTWRVGGCAEHYLRPKSLADLAACLPLIPQDLPIQWLGLGSNVLIADQGLRGVLVHTHKALMSLDWLDLTTVRVEAGVPCAKLARHAARASVQGLGFFAGIPGTIGGALAMNAGAFGGQTWSCVKWVETLDRQGVIRWRSPSDFEIGYRFVRGPENEWFVAAILAGETCVGDQGWQSMKDCLRRRAQTQPIGLPSCGSVFRNPPNDFAARLIEQSGLKGARVGGAVVSKKHANFIINEGGASADDIHQLMNMIQSRVLEACRVELEPEVIYLGEWERDK